MPIAPSEDALHLHDPPPFCPGSRNPEGFKTYPYRE